MKHIILFLFLLSSVDLYAQITYGEVVYKVTYDKEALEDYINSLEESTQAPLKSIHTSVIQALPYISYTLKFNKNEAVFSTTSSFMSSDSGVSFGLALGYTGSKGIRYVDLKQSKSLWQLNNYGVLWLVEDDLLDFDWKIINETRSILGYTCYKAISVLSSDKPTAKTTEIVAWFAPELPFQFGPINTGGLPGLIMRLDYRNFIYIADKVFLDTKETKIQKPKKGRYVSSFTQYLIELEEAKEKFKRLYRPQ